MANSVNIYLEMKCKQKRLAQRNECGVSRASQAERAECTTRELFWLCPHKTFM